MCELYFEIQLNQDSWCAPGDIFEKETEMSYLAMQTGIQIFVSLSVLVWILTTGRTSTTGIMYPFPTKIMRTTQKTTILLRQPEPKKHLLFRGMQVIFLEQHAGEERHWAKLADQPASSPGVSERHLSFQNQCPTACSSVHSHSITPIRKI